MSADSRTGKMASPKNSAMAIAQSVVARLGVDHLGAAWLHAHDAIASRPNGGGEVAPMKRQSIADEYDPATLDPDDPFDPNDDALMVNASWTPFQDMQRKESREIVSRALGKLTPRQEFVLRHVYGIGMDHLVAEDGQKLEYGRAFSMPHVSKRLGLSSGRVDQNFGKALRVIRVSERRGGGKGYAAYLRAALEQFDDMDRIMTHASMPSDFSVSIRHGHDVTIQARANREAEHVFRSFWEMQHARTKAPTGTAQEQMRWIETHWVRLSEAMYEESFRRKSMEGDMTSRRVHAELEQRFDDQRAIRRQVDNFSKSSDFSMIIAPAASPGPDRRYRIIADFNGWTSDDLGIRIPERGTIWIDETISMWMDHFMLADVHDAMVRFLQAARSKEPCLRSE
jgi:hypothetical protein